MSPYALMTSSKPTRSRKRWISSVGTVAAPRTRPATTTCRHRRRRGRSSNERSSAWRAEEHGDPLTFDDVERLVRVEHRDRVVGDAAQHAAHDAPVDARTVREGADGEEPVARAQRPETAPRPEVANELPVAELHALGLPRRARGEQDLGEGVVGDLRDAAGELRRLDRRPEPAQVVRRRRVGGPAGVQQHEMLQRRQSRGRDAHRRRRRSRRRGAARGRRRGTRPS